MDGRILTTPVQYHIHHPPLSLYSSIFPVISKPFNSFSIDGCVLCLLKIFLLMSLHTIHIPFPSTSCQDHRITLRLTLHHRKFRVMDYWRWASNTEETIPPSFAAVLTSREIFRSMEIRNRVKPDIIAKNQKKLVSQGGSCISTVVFFLRTLVN